MGSATAASARVVPPPRGTRPRNRRELIRAAAAALFAEKGYSQVSIVEIAAAVNVTPPAIYRHYSGKTQILCEVVATALDTMQSVMLGSAHDSLDETLRGLAAGALDHRYVAVLWQRESRHLPEVERTALRSRVRESHASLAEVLRLNRPELSAGNAEILSAAMVAAFTSVSFHHLELPRPAYDVLLTEMGLRIVGVDPAGPASKTPVTTVAAPASRRERLLEAATALFASRGFDSVSINDIGAAVGIAGPSVYNHFPSKQALLVAAIDRGHRVLVDSLAASQADGVDEAGRLRRISDGYVDLTLDHNDAIAMLIAETGQLDDSDRARIRAVQRAFIDDWVTALKSLSPRVPRTAARVKVQAAQMVANDLGRTRYLHGVPGFRETVREICWTIQI